MSLFARSPFRSFGNALRGLTAWPPLFRDAQFRDASAANVTRNATAAVPFADRLSALRARRRLRAAY